VATLFLKHEIQEMRMKPPTATILLLLLLPSVLSAQIIYTDITPDTLIADVNDVPGQYRLDLNRDGDSDYFFMHIFFPIPVYVLSIHTEFRTAHEILLAPNSKVEALDHLTPINETAGKWYCTTDGTGSSGMSFANEWIGTSDNYIGLRLFRNGGWYYGWLRATVLENETGIILKDYAVQTQRDTPILAGDAGTQRIDAQPTPEHYSIEFRGRSLTVTLDKTLMVRASVYDAMGREKIHRHDRCTSMTLDLSTLSAGVYFLRLYTDRDMTVKRFYFAK
jgi:hypothetical protein